MFFAQTSTDLLSAQWGASSSKTMVLQYTRGRLNGVFVEMKNVMINLITDSDGDLWMDREGDDGKIEDTV